MSPLATSLLLLGAIGGVGLVGAGYTALNGPERPGRLALGVSLLALGAGSVALGVVGFVPSLTGLGTSESLWPDVFAPFWTLASVAWLVFALRFTGVRPGIGRRQTALIAAPQVLIVGLVAWRLGGINRLGTPVNVVLTLLAIYFLSLAVGGSYLVLRHTHRHPRSSAIAGVSLALVPLLGFVTLNTTAILDGQSLAVASGTYVSTVAATTLAAGVGLGYYSPLASIPAVGTLGQQALTRETDDLMIVVDDEETIVRINETAIQTLDTSREAAQTRLLQAALGYDIDTLESATTVSLQTADGTRRYDPQITPVTDPGGRQLGYAISLREVTTREVRKQRLAVLNRVLRHNLRNEVDVINAHTEALAAENTHVEAITDATDALATLGRQATAIDRTIAGSREATAVDLETAVLDVLDRVSARTAAVAIHVDVPTDATIVTDAQALRSALTSALDNAVAYAASRVTVTATMRPTGCRIRIADDGPGIPTWEREAIEAGTEAALEHSTGLGLWRLKWAVMICNGELRFEVDEGTTVELVLPDRDRAAG